jgi:DNA-binding NtrC family response regulator
MENTIQKPRIRVLFVDDEVGFVDVVAKRMAKRGMDVTKTYGGAQAFQALRKNDFDVVILDLKMEDMDGIEVLQIIKKMAPDLEVIMLTGHGSEKAARDGIKFGAADYLTKPCEFEDLMDKIKEVYSTRR